MEINIMNESFNNLVEFLRNKYLKNNYKKNQRNLTLRVQSIAV